MTQEQLLEKCWEMSCVAGMNQRYYESVENSQQISHWTIWVLSVTLAALAPTLIRVSAKVAEKYFAIALLTAISLLASLGVNSHFTSTRLVTRLRCDWTHIRADVEQLNIAAMQLNGQDVPGWCVERLQLLHARRVTIMSSEPVTDQALLDRCYKEECRARGVASVKAGEP